MHGRAFVFLLLHVIRVVVDGFVWPNPVGPPPRTSQFHGRNLQRCIFTVTRAADYEGSTMDGVSGTTSLAENNEDESSHRDGAYVSRRDAIIATSFALSLLAAFVAPPTAVVACGAAHVEVGSSVAISSQDAVDPGKRERTDDVDQFASFGESLKSQQQSGSAGPPVDSSASLLKSRFPGTELPSVGASAASSSQQPRTLDQAMKDAQLKGKRQVDPLTHG